MDVSSTSSGYSAYPSIATTTNNSSSPLGLAKAALQKRYLNDMGKAIEKGDLETAKAVMQKSVKAFGSSTTYAAAPATTTSTTTTNAEDTTLSKDMKAIYDNISKDNVVGAQDSWKQMKTHLADAGVKNLANSSALAAQSALAATQNANTSVIGAIFGNSYTTPYNNSNNSSNGIFNTNESNNSNTSFSNIVSNWLTYTSNGNKSSLTNTTGEILNALA